jgi:hypothetical protein
MLFKQHIKQTPCCVRDMQGTEHCEHVVRVCRRCKLPINPYSEEVHTAPSLAGAKQAVSNLVNKVTSSKPKSTPEEELDEIMKQKPKFDYHKFLKDMTDAIKKYGKNPTELASVAKKLWGEAFISLGIGFNSKLREAFKAKVIEDCQKYK